MARYNDDLEALRTWADPSIPHDEKLALLGMGAPLSSRATAQNAGGASGDSRSDVPDPVPGMEQGGAPNYTQRAPTSVQDPTLAPGGLPPTSAQIASDATLAPVQREQAIERNAAAAQPAAVPGAKPVANTPLEGSDDARPGEDPRLALMAWRGMTPGGAAPKPTEQVREETQVQRGGLTPEMAGEYMQAREQADYAALDTQRQQLELEQRQQAAQLRAAEAAQAERDDLERIRTLGMQRAQDLMKRQDEISREVAQMPPVEPSLYAGKNFGESLLTALSLMAFGAGAGATHTSGEIVPLAQSLANREVDKQARLVAAKRGQIDAFGSILERHMANLKDIELAKRATVADILGIGEMQSMKLAQQSAQPLAQQKLAQQAAALKAARLQEMAQLQAQLGDKVMQQTSLAYIRERQKAAQAQPLGLAAPAPPGAPSAPSNAPIDASSPLSGEELDSLPGAPQAPGAPGGASPQAPAPPAVAAALQSGAELWSKGHVTQALASLPPTIARAVEAQAQRLLKNESIGKGANREDALAWSLNSLLGWPVPQNMVPASARDRSIVLPGGKVAFAPSGEAANDIRKKVEADSKLMGMYQQLINIAQKPAAKWSPEDRTTVETFHSVIMPALAVSLGQGALADAEAERYKGPSGGDVNSWKDFLMGTGVTAAKAGLQMVRTIYRGRLEQLSSSPFDHKPMTGWK